MCVRLLRRLLDRRQGSAADDVCQAVGSLGPPWLCLHPRGRRPAVLRGVACRCGAGIGQGSLLPGAGLACRPSFLGYEGCFGPSAGRMVGGGFPVGQRGNPHRLVAPGGVLGSHGMPFACGAPGPLGTVVALSGGMFLW